MKVVFSLKSSHRPEVKICRCVVLLFVRLQISFSSSSSFCGFFFFFYFFYFSFNYCFYYCFCFLFLVFFVSFIFLSFFLSYFIFGFLFVFPFLFPLPVCLSSSPFLLPPSLVFTPPLLRLLLHILWWAVCGTANLKVSPWQFLSGRLVVIYKDCVSVWLTTHLHQ